jgi:hypothetical protein
MISVLESSSSVIKWNSVDVEPCVRSFSKRPSKAEIRSMRLLHSLRASFLRSSFFHVLETSLRRQRNLHLVYRRLYLITLADFIGAVDSCASYMFRRGMNYHLYHNVACCVCYLQQQKIYCKIVVYVEKNVLWLGWGPHERGFRFQVSGFTASSLRSVSGKE